MMTVVRVLLILLLTPAQSHTFPHSQARKICVFETDPPDHFANQLSSFGIALVPLPPPQIQRSAGSIRGGLRTLTAESV